jgi:PAS domain S-box-containing protein
VKTNVNPKPNQAARHPVLDSIRFSPIATVVSDPTKPDNPLIAVNAAFCTLTGYTEDEVIGRNCRFLRGPDTENAQTEKLRSAVHGQHPALAELINYRKDGTPFRNAVMIAPLFDNDGNLELFVGSQIEVLPEEDRRPTFAPPARDFAADGPRFPDKADCLSIVLKRKNGSDAPHADVQETVDVKCGRCCPHSGRSRALTDGTGRCDGTLYAFAITHNRIALANPHGVPDSRRSTSICATNALTGKSFCSAARFNASQKSGSRLIEV